MIGLKRAIRFRVAFWHLGLNASCIRIFECSMILHFWRRLNSKLVRQLASYKFTNSLDKVNDLLDWFRSTSSTVGIATNIAPFNLIVEENVKTNMCSDKHATANGNPANSITLRLFDQGCKFRWNSDRITSVAPVVITAFIITICSAIRRNRHQSSFRVKYD